MGAARGRAAPLRRARNAGRAGRGLVRALARDAPADAAGAGRTAQPAGCEATAGGPRGMSLLESIEVATGPSPTGSVIWLHGLGADGHDFEPIVPDLVRPGERALRF